MGRGGAAKLFLGVAKWNCLLLDIWWLVELLYWFKTNFSLKISGILPCEIQKVTLCEIRFHSKNLGGGRGWWWWDGRGQWWELQGIVRDRRRWIILHEAWDDFMQIGRWLCEIRWLNEKRWLIWNCIQKITLMIRFP